MFYNQENISYIKLSIKYLILQKTMHLFLFIVPLFVFSVFMPINFFFLNSDFNDLKFFTINAFIFFLLSIPFCFLPLTIDTIKWNHIINIFYFKKREFLKFYISIISFFFIYFCLMFLYFIFLVTIVSLFIKNINGDSFFDYIFKSRPYNSSYFDNSINWTSFIAVLPISFVFCFLLSIPISWIFVKKNLLVVICFLYIIFFLLSPFFFSSYSLIPNNGVYQKMFFFFPLYYPGSLFSFAFSGLNFFNISDVLGYDNQVFITANHISIIYIIIFSYISLFLVIALLLFLIKRKQFDPISYIFSKSKKNKKLIEILEYSDDKNIGITSKSSFTSQIVSRRIYRISRSKNNIVCIASNVDSFIPEFSFMENFLIVTKIFKHNYDRNLLNNLIYLLNLQIVVTKKIYNLKPSELIVLNLVYALLLKPKKIIFINPTKHISNTVLIDTINEIKNYINENNIKVMIINKEIKKMHVLCDEIIYIKNHKNIKYYSTQEWLDKINANKQQKNN